MSVITVEELRDVMSGIVGNKILQSHSGKNTGSIFTMDFGDQLIKEEKKGYIFYKGSMSIMVWCAWRLLDEDNSVVTGWHEDSSENGRLTVGLKSLTNDIVREVRISDNFDLTIVTNAGKSLQVFCDLTPGVVGDTNWSFFIFNETTYSIDCELNCSLQLPTIK